ncbi:ATP-binding cassette domain-containing protein, partial [Salsipaludibacter albus]|uniref:ATP-binding cassette domain-containing protein n=1 Tax=Salsipaludibacter albus TaxID=2849650 RepID=UPI001EE4E42D
MAASSSGSAARSLTSVHLRGVSFAHSTAVPVLDDVTLDVGPGLHAVVGPNGAGKSTLLDLVDGTLTPTSGRVDLVHDGPVRRVRQDATDLTDVVGDFALRWDGDAVTWRRRFGLDVDDLADWSTRSPGRRMQWHLAAALASDPDVLVLDEPTNHLDAGARDRFVKAVRAGGVPLVLLVSHDRAVLDDLAEDTLRVSDGDVVRWAGGWTEAHGRWEAADAAAPRSIPRWRVRTSAS